MFTFYSQDKDYIIEFERKSFILWATDSSYKYLCKFIFKNNLGNILLELITSEEDIFVLISHLYQYIEFGSYELGFSFNQNNTILNSFDFMFRRSNNPNEPCVNYLEILEYNPLYQIMVKRIKLRLDDEYLNGFILCIYNEFIKDLDDGNYNPDFLL